MTILSIIRKSAAVCNITVPSSVVSSVDDNIKQMMVLAQMEGEETSSSFDWRNLKTAMSIAGDGVTAQFLLPPDFDRFAPGMPLVSSAYPRWPLVGPVDDDTLLRLKSIGVLSPVPCWRLVGGAIEFWPAPAAGTTITSEYRSSAWILSGVDGTTRQPEFLSDSDISLVPERVIMLGVVWRWKAAKGLEYAEDFRSWSNARDLAAGHETGNKVVRMSRYAVSGSCWLGTITDNSPTDESGLGIGSFAIGVSAI